MRVVLLNTNLRPNPDRVPLEYRCHVTGGTVSRRLDQRSRQQYGDLTKADSDVEQAIVINDSVIMIRERAKAGACEILWPDEDIPAGQKVVNVAWGDR